MLDKHGKIKEKCKYILKSLENGEKNGESHDKHMTIVAVLILPQRMEV